MSRVEIKGQGLAERWQALIGTNGIKSKADLARYLGVSRAKVSKVFRILYNTVPVGYMSGRYILLMQP
jgi:hypothetical protein